MKSFQITYKTLVVLLMCTVFVFSGCTDNGDIMSTDINSNEEVQSLEPQVEQEKAQADNFQEDQEEQEETQEVNSDSTDIEIILSDDELYVPIIDPEAPAKRTVLPKMNQKSLEKVKIEYPPKDIYSCEGVEFIAGDKKFFLQGYVLMKSDADTDTQIIVREDEKTTKTDKNCLVLLLAPYFNENSDDGADESESEKFYFLVIDYGKKRQFLYKTDFFVEHDDTKIDLLDITGDGTDEIIISGIANKWMEWNVYDITDGQIEKITTNYYSGDSYGYSNYIWEAFECRLLANYKVEIICDDIDYHKIISYKNGLDVDETRSVDSGDIYVFGDYDDTNDGYTYFNKLDKKGRIAMKLNINIWHDSECGMIDVFLKYDKSINKLIIDEVNYIPE